ncbi:hypothetical protein ABTC85_15420 [Acinetobacter baumannii]|uniref:Uncharacterized protein n=2 Tax=Acinetobacter baumannii TaxID=470 RepID=A0A0C4XXE5_ACIBA|nr:MULTISPECIES: hypothetical protein [Acinetobacter calcoaceticus/baumannii complex]AFI97480.1 hypothetical protein ABTJ_p0102 [Acinetobacter baumannii MDR-TJ]AJF79843.1 hypothetical protein NG19_007 [Acinetobacter baumannii]MCP9159777.1 hypothetical protein [Acinetobacter baumannii]MCP9185772.1 hypothetical protein [Acinetobacter baumannii]MCP9217233.1 hypothetical protein [Acinetobacter baumannii]
MQNIIFVFPFIMILAVGMAWKYRDDPTKPFEDAMTFGWWGFGITLILTIIVAVTSNKEHPDYVARVIHFASMPAITLVFLGAVALMKSSVG